MPLINATNLGKSYGPNDILSGVNLSIPNHARIGLVGPNGVGKTTLIKLLLGFEEPSSGEIQRAKGIRLGYLPQEASLEAGSSVWDECLGAFTELLTLEKELARQESQMGHSPDAAALQTYGRLQAEFERQGGYTYETRMRQTLNGLGFSPADYKRPIEQLSGGQRTRVLLAKLLLSAPDLLLLDEPTNHLDIAAIEWLEAYLTEWPGAVLIVSHDRYFLDRVANLIWEMTPALEVYHGNYTAYLAQRAERYRNLLDEFLAQQEFIEKEEEYIRRNLAGQNTRQAQGRRKRLERLLETARLAPPTEQRRLHLRLEAVARSGNIVLRTSGLQIGYADEGRPLFSVPDLVLQRGECAAILGPNGAGKTTFLKTLLEQIPPYQGEAELGASLQVGYFAQAHESLRPERTLLQEIEAAAPAMRQGEIRDYLAKFLFTGDDAFKEVRMLSGGERGRLALACLALSGANLLLLDEPTNHLDLPSQEVLQSILSDYNGTILLVSHDRYLIDALATQIWEVQPEQGRLRVFEGTYSEYRAELEAAAARQTAQPAAEAPRLAEKDEPGQRARSSSGSTNKERQRKAHLAELEKEIAGLEEQIAVLSRQLENPPADPARVQKMGQDYLSLQKKLEERFNEWSELAEEIG